MANLTESRTRLQGCGPFGDLAPQVLDVVFDAMLELQFAQRECLMHEGAPGDRLLVVLEGRANAFLESRSPTEAAFATFGPGDPIGEMALLTDQPRSATVVAETPMRCLSLGVEEFRRLASRHPEVAVVLTNLLAERLGEKSVDGMGGKHLDRYRIDRGIARGGMSVVYEAVDELSGRRVALKMMSHRLIYEPSAAARFLREAEILLTLDHVNIARVFHQFEAFRTYFIAMEYCDGPDLKAIIERPGLMPVEAVRAAIGQVAAALHYLHGLQVIHRDLKPANIISTRDGTLKVTDFGLAKPLAKPSSLISTEERSLLGTPLYMSPEQILGGELDWRSDVYALGCIGAEMVTGKPLFSCRNLGELIVAKLSYKPPDAGSFGRPIPPELGDFLACCLEREPLDRDIDLAEVASWAAPLPASVLDR